MPIRLSWRGDVRAVSGVRVAVLGASRNPDRHSHQACVALLKCGFEVVPVNPSAGEIVGIPISSSLDELKPPVHTVTVYLNASRSSILADALLRLAPVRVIFNPGAENPALADQCRAAGIESVNACTLLLLSTRQF